MKTKETSIENQLNDKVDGVKLKTTREQALAWWKSLVNQGSKQRKVFLKYYNPFERTQFSLTGREIEEIWKNELPLEERENYYGMYKPNQKQFKQFDESLFKAYIDKFSDEDKVKAVEILLNSFNKSYKIEIKDFITELQVIK